MAIFPQNYYTQGNVPVQSGPPELRPNYASSVLATKFCGPPKGVYQGFIPSAMGGVLTFAVDPVEEISLAKVHSNADPGGMDVIVNTPVVIDFTTSSSSDFLPNGVQVILTASYSDAAPTTAGIFPRPVTPTMTLDTVGGTPATFDFSTVSPLGVIVPSSVSIVVNVNGVGSETITDDGNGNLVNAVALPNGGTIDYSTGQMTGVTALLTAASTVVITFTYGVGKDEVLLCVLTNASSPSLLVVSAIPGTTQDTPLAFPDTDFGFMPAGSVEELAAAVQILNEVIAARTDLQGVVHTSLSSRLATDLGGPAMAGRLGHIERQLQSNAYSAPNGASSMNVSDSLSATSRTAAPPITLDGGGSETVVGAITDPTDTVRNVCFLVNSVTGDRIIADPTSRTIVFGRLVQAPDLATAGSVLFTNALTSITGVNTNFTSQFVINDLILGPDGNYYAIAGITSATQATLATAFLGSNGSQSAPTRRRFTINFRWFSGGAEAAYTFTAATPIRFFFPVFITDAQSTFDGAVTMYAPGERPSVPAASTTVPGKILLADASSPYVGAINIQLAGSPVGSGPFHTLNFTGSPGGLSELSPGVIDAGSVGVTGPPGPGSGPGPPGPPGLPGPNITQISAFAPKGTEDFLGPGPTPVNISFSQDFGYNVRMLSGGLAEQNVPSSDVFFAGRDTCTVTDIRLDSTTVGTITGTGGSGTVVASVLLYLDAAGA